jgi:hypothetical protein
LKTLVQLELIPKTDYFLVLWREDYRGTILLAMILQKHTIFVY